MSNKEMEIYHNMFIVSHFSDHLKSMPLISVQDQYLKAILHFLRINNCSWKENYPFVVPFPFSLNQDINKYWTYSCQNYFCTAKVVFRKYHYLDWRYSH